MVYFRALYELWGCNIELCLESRMNLGNIRVSEISNRPHRVLGSLLPWLIWGRRIVSCCRMLGGCLFASVQEVYD